jgi:hypothetical protein
MHSIAMDLGRWTTATTYGQIALAGYNKYYGQRAHLVAALLLRLVVLFVYSFVSFIGRELGRLLFLYLYIYLPCLHLLVCYASVQYIYLIIIYNIPML